MVHNSRVMFFSHLEKCVEIFSHKYSTFSQQIATASLQKAFTNIANHSRRSILLAIGTCALVLLHNMRHDWKKYNQSQLGKEKSAYLRFIWQQNNFLPVFSLCIKSKTKEKAM